MSDKLKPCPFCGSDAEIVYYDQYPEKYGVGCSKCPAILAELCEYKLFDSEAEAAEAWNRRSYRGVEKDV